MPMSICSTHYIAGRAPEDVEAPGTSNSDTRASSLVGRWRCFIKSVNVTHIILCFVPTSLDDLRSLVHLSEAVVDVEKSDLEAGAPGVEEGQGKQTEESEDMEPPPECDGSTTHGPGVTWESSEQGKEDPCEQHVEKKDHPLMASDPEGETCSSVHEPAQVAAPKAPEAVPVAGPEKKPPTSLVIPVYAYNCPLSGLTDQLVNRCQPQADLYQDFTKKVDMCVGEGRHSMTEDGVSASNRHRVDSETIRDKIRQSAEERPESGSGGGAEFRHHLSLINEHYHRSFVIGQSFNIVIIPIRKLV